MLSTAIAANEILASTRKSVEDILSEIGGLLADLTSQEHPSGVSEDEENEEARRVIDVELQRFWQGYYELKRRHEENALSVAVLALTKSGKSTLLNALMGMEALPMNNIPETARICRITHDATAREPLLRDASGKVLVRGEAAVRARLQQLNSAARTSCRPLPPQPPGVLGSIDTELGARGAGSSGGGSTGAGSPSPILHIDAPLVALEGYGPEFGRVTLLDTPGPNEAGEEQLRHQVERLLEGVDCVLYLLDYTKLKTAEEEDLFHRLRAINPQLVARLSSRLFFVINKVDASETSEGLDPDEVRNYVADLVTRQLGGAAAAAAPAPPAVATGSSGGSVACAAPGTPARAGSGGGAEAGAGAVPQASPLSVVPVQGGAAAATPPPLPPFRLHPDQVLLLSARNALLARLVLAGRASTEAAKRFQRLAFGAFGGVGPGFGFGGFGSRGPATGPSNEQVRAAAGCLLEGSGILDLEGRVLTFLAAHAGSVKLLATADDLARLLAQVRNVALACRSCLHRNVAALRDQTEAMRVEVSEATAAFEEVRKRTDAVKAEVVEEIKSHLKMLRSRLFTYIVQTLDADVRAKAPAAATATATGAQPTSHWERVREKFLSMFTASCSIPPPLPRDAGPSLVPEARSRSREELQALLLELHDDLMGQIHSEVYEFWGVLEACAAIRHSELLSALNGHLAALSRRVEGAVSGTLEVQLAAADIRLRPPSAEQLHSDVQELIDKGIRESTEKHIRVGARTTTEKVFRQPQGSQSLCRWGGYWVEVPRTRTVVETYTATVFSLKPDEIANHFISLVDSAVAASEQALETYVGVMVERQLLAARERIRDYGDRYLSVMSAALAASSRGAECRSFALASVEGYLARLDGLMARAEAAQLDAAAAVPGGAAGLMDDVEVYDEVYDEGGYSRENSLAQQQAQNLREQEAQEVATVEGLVKDLRQAPTPEEEVELELQPAQRQVACVVEEAAEVDASLVPTLEVAATLFGSSSITSVRDIDDAEYAIEALALPGAAEPAHDVECGSGNFLASFGAARSALPVCTATVAVALPEAVVEAEGPGGGNAIFDQRLSGDAVVAAEALNQQEPRMQGQEQESCAPTSLPAITGPAAATDVSQGSSAVSIASSACVSSSYTAIPFDYSRAFVEAMSSSEMATGAKLDEPLTMIPLTSDCGSKGGVHSGEATAPAAGCEADTPFSGTSEDWQLVGEEALEPLP